MQFNEVQSATTFAEERPGFDRLSCLPGAPAYLSPEQTGRMNRPVDYRTDLYSLGAILYALATGRPPFEGTDTLALIHAHLACAPPSPRERAPWLPPRVAELILTLLAKEPDERYQSAAGLAHDLRQLRTALARHQPLAGVRLKERDLPLAPRPPHRPFFTIEFIQALYREGALRPDPQRGRWHWDLGAIAAHPASANVVDFLADGLRDLDPETADTLVAAAGLGNACTLGLLALVTDRDPGDLALGPPWSAGF